MSLLRSTIALLLLISSTSAHAEEKLDKTIDFNSDIHPILKQHCLECHGSKHREGGLRFLSKKDLSILNDSGEPAVVVGENSKSELIHRVATTDEDLRMPPAGEKEPLSKNEISLLRKWIDQGAVWPAGKKVAKHWSYQKPKHSDLPKVKNKEWVQNPIDSFVLAKLESLDKPILPSPKSDPAKLLRRVYLDLIGLPPSPEQVDEFVKNSSQEEYEKVVDGLLKSPRYGEKWARQWLDLARYADSNGFQADQFREMWMYRDWVIKAMNDDMPFDQFTVEQLAGDLLPNATFQQKIATGFHRCTTCNVEAGVDPEENRVNQIFDRVNTTGLVWLGTTFECAQCHNHKYDPITQQEYYQIFAYFNNTPIEVKQTGKDSVTFEVAGPKLEAPLSTEDEKKRIELFASQAELSKLIKVRRKELKKIQLEWEEAALVALEDPKNKSIPKSIKTVLLVASKKRTAKQKRTLDRFQEKQDESCSKMLGDLEVVKEELAETEPETSFVMIEMENARKTNIFKRGDFLSKGIEVQAKTPDALHQLPSEKNQNRLSLAKWITSKENPLVSRVTVNRWWGEFFGHGLVSSEEDFGTQGEKPTHPELLDWLALEFTNNRWSMKHVHRTIVMSNSYQQSSKVTEELLDRDSNNLLYARGPRIRLAAEEIRDNALAISGLISNKMAGPPIYPPQPENIWRHVGRNAPKYIASKNEDRYRRGIYVVWRRSAPYPSFINFDATDRGACTIKRSRTNTPLQALTLLNDPAYMELTLGLAKRLATKEMDSKTYSDKQRIEFGFRLALARQPTQKEVDLLHEFYVAELKRFQNNPQAAAKTVAKADRPNGIGAGKIAAWFYIANILLNLDETITKG